MRIAMAAVILDDRSRSVNIARALSLIDAAASAEDSVDLVVVPAGCDAGGAFDERPSPAMVETYRASLSAKAREWGVYVAAGQRSGDGDPPQYGATLLDADGDEIATCPSPEAGSAMALCDTLIGTIGLSLDSAGGLNAARTADPSPPPRAMIVIGGRSGASGFDEEGFNRWQRLAIEWGSFVCRVGPAAGPEDSACVQCSDSSLLESRIRCVGGEVVTVCLPDETP